MRKKSVKKLRVKQDPRTEKITILLSKEEHKLLNYFVRKYRYQSRSGFVRKLVMTHIVSILDANYPTLFEQENISDSE